MKKIALVENGWAKFINLSWILGLKEYLGEHDIDANIYVFNSFGNFSLDEKFDVGEYNIAKLPDFTAFDGIFVELTNIGDPAVKEEIVKRVIDSKVPAVSLVEEIPGMYYAGIDNYAAMKKMVSHLVEEHQCRQINYVGGPKTSSENMARFQAYKDVLQENGIPFEKERVYHFNYEIVTGEQAFDHFYEKEQLPEAFVCANDNIAVGICHQAERKGYRAPDDFFVTGFDNFDKASYYSPRISTIGFRRETIAYAGMQMMHNIWEGRQVEKKYYIDTECVFQESCGCKAKNPKDRGQYVIDRIMADDRQNKLQTILHELKRELLNCNDFFELAACLPKTLSVLGYEELYIMMNEDLLDMCEREEEPEYRTEGYPENMKVLLAAIQDCILGGITRAPGRLIPGAPDQEGGNTYLFSPLHLRDREMGYTILKNCEHLMDSQMLYEVLNAFLETMQNLYQRMVLARMNDKLSNLYIRDSLTGIYNRMAYNKLAVPEYERCMRDNIPLLIMFWDLDRLKYINDTFGHDMGNAAIKVITDSIQECCMRDTIAMRYGGDEFVVLVSNTDETKAGQLVEQIGALIDEKSQLLNAPFEITASVGYVIARDVHKSLNDCINLADEKMYDNKKKRCKCRNTK